MSTGSMIRFAAALAGVLTFTVTTTYALDSVLGCEAGESRPVAELLNPDGTLNMTTGYSGALDIEGFDLKTDASGVPRLVRSDVETEADVPLASSHTANPDDQRGDRFSPLSTNARIEALAVIARAFMQTAPTPYEVVRHSSQKFHSRRLVFPSCENKIHHAVSGPWIGGDSAPAFLA